jgi:competence protein ComEC
MTWQHPVEQARQAVRDDILARVDDRQRPGGIVAALVTGDQNAIDRADWDVFRATGVAHLMSISGLHITMFAWVAAAVVGWLWRRSPRLCLALPAQHAALAGGLLLAAAMRCSAALACPRSARCGCWPRWPPCALRGCAGPGRWCGCWPAPWWWRLDPWALLQPGFWLSFVAVGVLFATDAGPTGRTRGAAHHVRALLREQTVVTLALTPLTCCCLARRRWWGWWPTCWPSPG